MGWQPESTLFRCKPGIVIDLQRTARSYDHCCMPAGLWVQMLREHGGRSAQGRINLTQLLRSRTLPEVLPAWVLSSHEVRKLLVVDGTGEVFVTEQPPSPYLTCFPPNPEHTERVRVHREKTAAAEQKLQALQESGAALLRDAAAAAKQHGLLLSDPPLPAELLRVLPTTDMLSFSRVCKDLHVASCELLRREEAVIRSNNTYLGGNTEYVPLQVIDPVAAAMSELSLAESAAAAAAAEPVKPRAVSLGDRRYMRALSVLCGTPEATAALLAEAKATERSELNLVVGKKYDRYDGQMNVFRQLHIPGIELCCSSGFDDPYRCTLYMVLPEDLPSLISRVGRVRLQLECEQKHIDGVLVSAKVANKNGEALCLLHTLW